VRNSPLGHTHKPLEWLDDHIDGSFVVVVDHLQAQACVPRNSGALEVMISALSCGNASMHASEACL